MGETVQLKVCHGSSSDFVTRDVEPTDIPGLYVSPVFDGREGWLVVTACGLWISRSVRWKTPEDAHAAAALLGADGFDWTAPMKELRDDDRRVSALWAATREQLAGRWHPIPPREPQPPNKYRPSQARKTAADRQSPSIE